MFLYRHLKCKLQGKVVVGDAVSTEKWVHVALAYDYNSTSKITWFHRRVSICMTVVLIKFSFNGEFICRRFSQQDRQRRDVHSKEIICIYQPSSKSNPSGSQSRRGYWKVWKYDAVCILQRGNG